MDKDKIENLAKDFAVDKKLIEILIDRGYDSAEKLRDFLYPTLDNLSSVENYVGYNEVIERIKFAIDNGESVLIYGDYDCDGVCGTSILYNYFKSKGVNVNCFLPNRHTDGYGLSIETLEKLAEEYLSDLLITVDCGITSVEEVEYARETLGFDVIVTDHHEPGEVLPDCLIFNPKLSDCNSFTQLCGAGVALRIVEGLGGSSEMEKYLDIAAIATVADVVPLVGDNRIITYSGLKAINSYNARRGIKMLAQSCVAGEITAFDIAFKLAPRINSVGRLSDANGVLDLFCVDDNFLLTNVVNELNESNAKRMELTNDLTDYCYQMLKNFDFEENAVIVLNNPYWDDGIIGIVAARITERFHRPTILITKSGDIFKGSGRSIKGLNIYKYVSMCSDMLTKFGGHAMACGISIKEENIVLFAKKLNELIKADFDMSYFSKKIKYDIDMADVDSAIDMARGLKMLEPCGEGNSGIRFKESIKSKDFGQMGDTQHIVCRERDKETVIFGGLKYKEFLSQKVQKDLYFTLSLQTYKNRVYAQAKVNAIECGNVDSQGDYSSYLMTGFFKGRDSGVEISVEEAIALGNTLYSTCYIAYDIDTYNEFIKIYNQKIGNITTQNRCSTDCAPTTKIIFAPVSLKDLGYYKNIVLLDKPLGIEVFNRLNGKGKDVYYIQNVNILTKLKKYLPDYKELASIFIQIKETLSGRNYAGISDLYYAIAKKSELEYNKFVLSAVVLADLGILKMSDKLYIDSAVKTKLSESKIYKLIEG